MNDFLFIFFCYYIFRCFCGKTSKYQLAKTQQQQQINRQTLLWGQHTCRTFCWWQKFVPMFKVFLVVCSCMNFWIPGSFTFWFYFCILTLHFMCCCCNTHTLYVCEKLLFLHFFLLFRFYIFYLYFPTKLFSLWQKKNKRSWK